jgi:hypothetical protein
MNDIGTSDASIFPFLVGNIHLIGIGKDNARIIMNVKSEIAVIIAEIDKKKIILINSELRPGE